MGQLHPPVPSPHSRRAQALSHRTYSHSCPPSRAIAPAGCCYICLCGCRSKRTVGTVIGWNLGSTERTCRVNYMGSRRRGGRHKGGGVGPGSSQSVSTCAPGERNGCVVSRSGAFVYYIHSFRGVSDFVSRCVHISLSTLIIYVCFSYFFQTHYSSSIP